VKKQQQKLRLYTVLSLHREIILWLTGETPRVTSESCKVLGIFLLSSWPYCSEPETFQVSLAQEFSIQKSPKQIKVKITLDES